MSGDEIEVPKELVQFMPEGAKQTILGYAEGSIRQYRYGRLHIREYGDHYTVHTDAADPRVNPIGHLVHDAPEILVGAACSILCSKLGVPVAPGLRLTASLLAGYAGYRAAKKLRNTGEVRRQ